tara:strand:+ start:13441 stop:17319 length:3879 start_codon:yes stop_codon:yes gene_type:complete
MKKSILFLTLLLVPLLGISQTKNIVVNWGNPSASAVNSNKAAVSSGVGKSNDDMSISRVNLESLSYSAQWVDSGFSDGQSAIISNIKFGTLSSEELKKIKKELVPEKFSATLLSGKARDIIYTSITISPVVKTNGVFQKVLSFTLNYKKKSIGRQVENRMPVSNSVLASGDWYKFKVEKTGVHRITKDFLNSIGFNTDGVDARNIKIYGHGGKPLPLLNRLNTEFDLPENAIQVIGEEDGTFEGGDSILFYAIGTTGYDKENDTNLNPYSDEAFYYITSTGGPGLRVQEMSEPTGTSTLDITQFHDYQFHEEDEYSPAKVGRRWYGNRFDIENEQSYDFNFPNLVPGSNMNVVIKVASSSETTTSMAMSVNGTALNPITFGTINSSFYVDADEFVGEIPAAGNDVNVSLSYNNGGNPSSIGYLDYIGIEALRELSGTDTQLAFRYKDAQMLSGIGTYRVSNASQFTQVWDVTNTGFITTKLNVAGESTIDFKANMGELREYVAINPNDYYTPVQASQSFVLNQNIKGTILKDESGNFQDIDYIIVTPPFLILPALRLANHHKNLSGLKVKVVTTDKIYQEFSSGKQDIGAIRNMVRYVYENASSPENRLKYLCLFGDTSVDYKNRLSGNNNMVPSFHTLLSTNTISSFVSDDYFGNLDPDEGTIGGKTLDEFGNFINGDSDLLDVAVGRMIVDEVGLANDMVDKVINYADEASYGNWRNNFLLISDDLDDEQRVQFDLDRLGDEISLQRPEVNVKKIHSDAFQQETSAGGNRYPQVNELIENDIEVGALIVNYFGHGGEDGLAAEFIYTKEIATGLQNKSRMPLIVTVTCEFAKFDLPTKITVGELTYWNPTGGAIALITTTRSIFVSLGVDYNDVLAPLLFGFGQNVPVPPAEALRLTKNTLGTGAPLRRVVFYIGDPAMRLAFPKKEIRLTTLNGVPIAQATDTLKALSRVRMGGEVVNEFGNLLTGYNGVLEAKIFDKQVQRQTLGNDGIIRNGELDIMDFTVLGETLFNGQASVVNGQFEFEFVVPRDIQIPVGTGRVSLYSNKDNDLEDQAGYNTDIEVGGLNEDAPEDNQGPLIRLFMNDESFVSGGITNDSPILIAKLEDANGINTASGIGHDIVAILDGDESNPFVINEYYQAEVDDFTRGTATYPFRDLEEGLHTLTLKAWDVYNNSSTAEIQFIVAGNDALEITRVLNYPNPFVDYTEFWFNHNRPFEPLEVQVQVFTVTGKVVWTKNQIVSTDGFLSRDIAWDGRDDFGDRIGKGVYVYKITVKSTLTNKRVEKFEKLVIL